ncbi:MAG: beta-lactamase family protein [Thermoflexibacter sp.]|jgi:CubicO group peptidase (beta-lactamase class C family)|nr:beta-lactamase family protein [Thermoflexibacter sp.]
MKYLCLLFSSLFISVFGFAQQAKTINTDSLSLQITQLIGEVGIPALSMAVIQSGKIVYSHAFGMSNVEHKNLTDSITIFEAASLTKPVVAVTVLKLVEEGIIELDKPLYDYLNYNYENITDPRIRNITARMVLSHTTGFPNWRNKNLEINFKPSEKFSYSGEGFVYLQKVVEKITGKTLDQLVTEKIFKPIGMRNSILIFNPSIHKNSAEGYNKKNGKVKTFRPPTANAAYSMLTTANDYALFVIALLKNQLLKEETAKQMFSPQINISTKEKKLSWGLGWGLEMCENETAFWHWGDNSGFKCFVIAFKDSQTALIYFTNSDKGMSIQKQMVDLTLGYPFALYEWLDYKQYEPKKSKK